MKVISLQNPAFTRFTFKRSHRALPWNMITYTILNLIGTIILIKHDTNWISAYAHCGSVKVSRGDKVKQGQIVAKSGNTGVSTGPHLHITIRENKTPVDPKKYLKGY